MKSGALIVKRYVLERQIGNGGSTVTWVASDRESGNKVVLKLLSLGAMEDWKGFELFEREASVLRSLHHGGIPAYLDHFTAGTGAQAKLVLVQEYVQGMNLQQKVAAGWRGTEEEICAIAGRLLEAVNYIHSLRPPIIHRDINPRNVIVRDDGAVFLVDFGGVQDALRVSANAGHTVIGTPGYMPMEQFVGRASVRSDLYACATTILFMLTHKDPQDLPVKDLKTDVSSIIDVSPGLAMVLNSWLEPEESKRRLSVEKATRYLQGLRNDDADEPGSDADSSSYVGLPPPRFSRIRVQKEGDVVTLVIPSRGAAGAAPFLGGFSVFWLAFVAFWTFFTANSGAWGMSLFSIPFWLAGFFLMRMSLRNLLGRTLLRFDPDKGFSYEFRLLFRKSVMVPAAEVGSLSISPTSLQFEIGARRFTFGENLSSEEKMWLKRNIQDLLKSTAGGR